MPSHKAVFNGNPILPVAARKPMSDGKNANEASQSMRKKIRNMIECALHPRTPTTEAEHAMRLASKLMRQYNLEQADIMRNVDDNSILGAVYVVEIRKTSGKTATQTRMAIPVWISEVASTCAGLCGVKVILHQMPSHAEFKFFGVEQNAHMAALGFEATINATFENAETLTPQPNINLKVTKNDYKTGVSNGLFKLYMQKKKDEEEEKQKNANEQSLVLYDKKLQLVIMAMQKEFFPDTCKAKNVNTRDIMDQASYQKGYEFGTNCDIQRQRLNM